MKAERHPDLDASHYGKNSSLQFQLAEDVLCLHSFAGSEHVLDVGCGDGKLTAKIAERVQRGSVCGIDPSSAMIQLAEEHYPSHTFPNLTFQRGAAEDFEVKGPFDLITAFSSLHWVRGQEGALRHMVSSLKSSGKLLILTYPQESPYYRFLEEVIDFPKWRPYADSSACAFWVSSSQYRQIIAKLHLKPLVLETIREDAIYQSERHFQDYVKGWLPCLISLPQNLQEEFLVDLSAHVRRRYGKADQEEFAVPYDKIVMYLEKHSS